MTLSERMIRQLRDYGIDEQRVLEAMAKVPREQFVSGEYRHEACDDTALPIDCGQTISQPYIVAYMTQALELQSTDHVLEVGTGSGYQTAVLAELSRQVYSLEVYEELASQAAGRLERLGYRNVLIKVGDGYEGWPDKRLFDAIMVTAAPAKIPPGLTEQLKTGGRMILPTGLSHQELVLVEKTGEGIQKKRLLSVSFVPMIKK